MFGSDAIAVRSLLICHCHPEHSRRISWEFNEILRLWAQDDSTFAFSDIQAYLTAQRRGGIGIRGRVDSDRLGTVDAMDAGYERRGVPVGRFLNQVQDRLFSFPGRIRMVFGSMTYPNLDVFAYNSVRGRMSRFIAQSG